MNKVEEIIIDLQNEKIKLSNILIKVLVLANKLKANELIEWAEEELGGFIEKDKLPNYRKGKSDVKGNFLGYRGERLNNYSLPLNNLSQQIGRDLNDQPIWYGIKSIESLLDSKEGFFSNPWPSDLLLPISESLITNYVCINAWWVIPRGRLEQILDDIKNKLLKFLLKLQEEYPDQIKSDETLKEIPIERTTVMVSNYIYGDQNTVTTGENNKVKVQNRVISNDIESLIKHLRDDLKIPENEVNELKLAIKQDGEIHDKNSQGKKVSEWIGKITSKLFDGTIKIASASAPVLIPKIIEAISNYKT